MNRESQRRIRGLEANRLAARYEDKGIGSTTLAREFGTCVVTVIKTLRRMGVPIRSQSEAVRAGWRQRKQIAS